MRFGAVECAGAAFPRVEQGKAAPALLDQRRPQGGVTVARSAKVTQAPNVEEEGRAGYAAASESCDW